MSSNKLTAREIYGYSAIRNITVVFGSIFSNFKVRKYNSDGSINEKSSFLVPIAYSAKTQYSLWLDQEMRLPNGNIEINNKFPRISFEMTGLSIEPSMGTNTNLPLVSKKIMKDGTQYKTRGPISYSFNFNLSIWTKQMDESIQLLDKILPIFTPEISIKVKESDSMNIVNDVKIVLNSVSKSDNYQDGFEQNRLITWDLMFTVYANIIPPDYESSAIIQKIELDIGEITSAYKNGTIPTFLKNAYGYNYDEYSIPPGKEK